MATVIHEHVDRPRRGALMQLRSFLTIVPLGLLLIGDAMAQEREDKYASRGELALSNDTLQLRYIGSGKPVGVDDGRIVGGIFLGEERDFVLSAALQFPADLGIFPDRLQLSFGPQVYAALLRDENDDVMAISVGAQLRFFIDSGHKLAIAGEAYYAPDILTFGSADNLTDMSARVEFAAAERVQVFGGMRWFEFDLTEGGDERTLMEEVFFGIGYRF